MDSIPKVRKINKIPERDSVKGHSLSGTSQKRDLESVPRKYTYSGRRNGSAVQMSQERNKDELKKCRPTSTCSA